MKSKLLVRVLLGVLAVLLVAGMVYQFTPALGSLRSGGQTGKPAIRVNGETITDQTLEAARQRNPVLSLAQSGPLGDDFKTVIVEQAVQLALLKAAVKDINVPTSEVNAQVDSIREQNGLKRAKDWTDALSQRGYSDASFRAEVRAQQAIQKKIKQIQDAAPKATEAEAKQYYDLHPEAFQSEPRIVGRLIAVSDQKKAQDLLAQAKGGADFAKLAGANSLEYKERGGALAPIENGQPRPVAQVALPAEVGAAAFALGKAGLTDVVKSGDKFYIVKVEQALPASVKPYADVQAEALKAVTTAKQQAATQTWLASLRKGAKIEVVDPKWAFENPVVGRVNGQDIPYAELVSQMAANPQLGQLLQSAPPDQAAGFVNGFFKPQVMTQLIQSYAAPIIAERAKLPLTGPREEILSGLLAYGARDVKVTDAQIQAAYQKDQKTFSTPASANVSEIVFSDKQKALAFRAGLSTASSDVVKAAAKAGGAVTEHGTVRQGETDPQNQQPKLSPLLDKAVFGAGRLQPAGDGSVSDVVEVGGRFSVAYVRELVPATVKPLAEVREQIRSGLLRQEKQTQGQKYVTEQLASLKVENKLDEVLKAQAKRVEAQKPVSGGSTSGSSASGASTSGGSASGGSASGGSAPGSSTPKTGN